MKIINRLKQQILSAVSKLQFQRNFFITLLIQVPWALLFIKLSSQYIGYWLFAANEVAVTSVFPFENQPSFEKKREFIDENMHRRIEILNHILLCILV